MPEPPDDARGSLATVIGASGLVLLCWAILEPVALFAIGSSVVFLPRYLVGYVTIVPSCLAMAWSGRWLARSDFPPEHHRRIAVYWLLGGGGFLAFNVGLMTFFPTESVWIVTNWLRWALTLGLAVGLLVGVGQSRAIYHTLAAERQSLRAEHAEQQRELVDHMNAILRHEVLNATQVILGNASSLREADGPIRPTDERLGRIHRQGEDVTAVIQEVRSLLGAMQTDRELTPMPLVDVVRTEAREITDRYPAVTVDVRVPADAVVRADELLGRLFATLLDSAVEYSDGESMAVTIEAETENESVVVTVRDDGSTVPERNLDALFDRPRRGDHGLGLYLVRELARSYGGTIDLVTTGEPGTTFEIRLPAADPSEVAERAESIR